MRVLCLPLTVASAFFYFLAVLLKYFEVLSQSLNASFDSHWCLKGIKSEFARATVPYPKNLDVLTPRIDAQK